MCLIFLINSCSKIIPTKFWTNYKSNLIVENISDHGPYGGHRATYWKAKTKNTFNPEKVIEFAKENGWILIGREEFDSENVKKWKSGNKPIFPLTSLGFKPENANDFIVEKFPRWINSNITVYKFKTNFIMIESGTDNSIEENGFILINENGTEMSVYNLWGE
ncbi:hypothetical protein E0I26_07400 [Flavobacterium rhamnosiphilum]|uniref:Uncharacterized protein n=1 Tax=Flavobacterium rhamnosiphilum TaxID=2541724 RepID=A0A4R5F908_9FLAO|nr:hypothetical protein E0I26_07400 [Flavobacterium rhamnosiphilum]